MSQNTPCAVRKMWITPETQNHLWVRRSWAEVIVERFKNHYPSSIPLFTFNKPKDACKDEEWCNHKKHEYRKKSLERVGWFFQGFPFLISISNTQYKFNDNPRYCKNHDKTCPKHFYCFFYFHCSFIKKSPHRSGGMETRTESSGLWRRATIAFSRAMIVATGAIALALRLADGNFGGGEGLVVNELAEVLVAELLVVHGEHQKGVPALVGFGVGRPIPAVLRTPEVAQSGFEGLVGVVVRHAVVPHDAFHNIFVLVAQNARQRTGC